MELIKDAAFGGERPLFASADLDLRNVTFQPGESALKCCRRLRVADCTFQGKYPLWHCQDVEVEHCLFQPGARAAIWYTDRMTMRHTQVDAPKMFREMDTLELEDVHIPDAQETLWHVRNVKATDCSVAKADYLFMHSANIKLRRWRQQGNYSFQYCRNVEIHDARIDSKDAFWATDGVTIYDSELDGEYLGWHSRGLRLVRCRISGTQPLCYCTDLVMEDCTMDPSCDLAFEDSILRATVLSPITSVKNPRSGLIRAASYGQVILDANLRAPGDCRLETLTR